MTRPYLTRANRLPRSRTAEDVTALVRLSALLTTLSAATAALVATSPRAAAAESPPLPDRSAEPAQISAPAVRPPLHGERPEVPTRSPDASGAAPEREPVVAPPRTESEPTVSESTVSESTVSESTVSESTVSEPTVPSPPSAPESGVAEALAAAPDWPASARLDHRIVAEVLRANGIGWRSSGRCSNRLIATCTSFETVRWGTVQGLIRFAESSGCEITVTGGTERGHAGGPHSHWNGYKLDIARSACVDRAVERYPSTGVRRDGARLYRAPDGALFAREKDHWDIAFT